MKKAQTSIGELNRRIQIQRATVSASATGMEVRTWETLYTLWAKVEFPQTGQQEIFLGDQQVATTRVNFTIRHRDGLGEKDRVVYLEQEYDILNIIEHGGRREYLIIQAEKRI